MLQLSLSSPANLQSPTHSASHNNQASHSEAQQRAWPLQIARQRTHLPGADAKGHVCQIPQGIFPLQCVPLSTLWVGIGEGLGSWLIVVPPLYPSQCVYSFFCQVEKVCSVVFKSFSFPQNHHYFYFSIEVL